MKKLFICFLLGLFLYGCSEINEPVQVNENKTAPTVIFKEEINIQTQTLRIIIKPDSSRLKLMSDSVIPPGF